LLIDESFGLEAEINQHAAIIDADHSAAHNRAFLKGRLLLLVLIEHRAEIEIAAATLIFVVIVVGCARRRSVARRSGWRRCCGRCCAGDGCGGGCGGGG
jgi:hypothetical protein